jgi:hypothetical protein
MKQCFEALFLFVLMVAIPLAMGQEGEIGLSWDPTANLCSGAVLDEAQLEGYYVFWDVIPREVTAMPPTGYANSALVPDKAVTYSLTGLQDCVPFYAAVATRMIDGTWSGCALGEGYSTEITSLPRQRMASVSDPVVMAGNTYTIVIQGNNFEAGSFTSGDGLTWAAPTSMTCNEITVDLDVAPDAVSGPRTIEFTRSTDGVVAQVDGLITVETVDPPGVPTNLRRTQVAP